MKRLSVLALTLVFLLVIPISAPSTNSITEKSFITSYDGEALLDDAPYVWQEINGFCSWAATSILIQHAGVPLDMHELFAASTIGFSWAYIEYQENMLMFPGALYQQVEPTDLAADLYGLNTTVYMSDSIDQVDTVAALWESRGINVGLLSGEAEAFDLMRASLDSGHPLLISVDPSWLPAYDYDILREQGLSGGGHGIVIVGYNDTSGTATIMDPGVGSFGDDFGYPDDGRGEFAEILYTALNSAWSSRYYISVTITPGGEPVEDIGSILGPIVRDKLLGVGTAYDPDSASAFIWKFGETGFRAMSETMTSDGLYTYLSQFLETQDQEFIASLILFIGLGLEAQTTLQYLSYKEALVELPGLMTDYDLTDFVSAGEDALPHFSAISNNASLIYPGNVTYRDSLVYGTFFSMAETYNSTGDLESTLQQYSDDLDIISEHLLGIADSWLEAGTALTVYWPNDFLYLYGPAMFLGGAVVAALVIGVIVMIRTKPSQ